MAAGAAADPRLSGANPWQQALTAIFGPPIDVLATRDYSTGEGLRVLTESGAGLYIWRAAVDPDTAAKLSHQILPCCRDIQAVWNNSERKTKVGTVETGSYNTFHTVRDTKCACFGRLI